MNASRASSRRVQFRAGAASKASRTAIACDRRRACVPGREGRHAPSRLAAAATDASSATPISSASSGPATPRVRRRHSRCRRARAAGARLACGRSAASTRPSAPAPASTSCSTSGANRSVRHSSGAPAGWLTRYGRPAAKSNACVGSASTSTVRERCLTKTPRTGRTIRSASQYSIAPAAGPAGRHATWRTVTTSLWKRVCAVRDM